MNSIETINIESFFRSDYIEHVVATPETPNGQPPLFFMHGAYHGAWCWKLFMDWFAKRGFTCHAISLPLEQQSSAKEDINEYSFQDYVDIMAEGITRVSPGPVLVSHSMGGAMAQKYLETNDLPGAVFMASVPRDGTWRYSLKVAKDFPKDSAAFLKNFYHVCFLASLWRKCFLVVTPEAEL